MSSRRWLPRLLWPPYLCRIPALPPHFPPVARANTRLTGTPQDSQPCFTQNTARGGAAPSDLTALAGVEVIRGLWCAHSLSHRPHLHRAHRCPAEPRRHLSHREVWRRCVGVHAVHRAGAQKLDQRFPHHRRRRTRRKGLCGQEKGRPVVGAHAACPSAWMARRSSRSSSPVSSTSQTTTPPPLEGGCWSGVYGRCSRSLLEFSWSWSISRPA